MRKGLIAELIILLFFVAATNKWMSMPEGISYVQADDSSSYLKIAQAAPGLPITPPAFHHAQRFFPHYLIGSLSRLTGLDLGWLYSFFALLLSIATLALVQRLLVKIGVDPFFRRILLACFAFSPYVFRYYWIAPTMLADLLFFVGLAIVFLALIEVRVGLLLFGGVLGLLGRQNMILVIPGVALWIAVVPAWKERFPLSQRFLLGGIFAALVVGLFLASARFVASFASPQSVGAHTFLGLFLWMTSTDFTWHFLGEHLLRVFLPEIPILLLVLSFLFAKPGSLRELMRAELLAAGLIAAALIAQSLLISPVEQGQNQSRQAIFSLLALVVASGYLFRRLKWRGSRPAAAGLLAFGLVLMSFHHMYTVVGPSNVTHYVFWSLLGSVTAAIAFFRICGVS